MRPTLFFMRMGMAILLLGGVTLKSAWALPSLTHDNEKIDFAQQLLDRSQYQLAASEFEEFITQYPQSTFLPQAYVGAGDSYFFDRDYTKAIGFYQQYAQAFPNGDKKWFVVLRTGQCLYLLGKQDDALTKLTSIDVKALQPPFMQTLYFYLGQVLMAQNNLSQAAVNFEKATALETSGGYTSQAYLQWGNVLAKQADYLKAMEKYKKAFEVADSSDVKAEILMKEAHALSLQGNYLGAAQLFNRITIDFPSLPVVKEATSNWFGTLLMSQQIDKLLTYYDQNIKDNFQDPELFSLHQSAAEALMKQNKYADALSILDKLAAAANRLKNPDRVTVKNALLLKAQALLGLKKDRVAWNTYAGIVRDFSDDPNAYCRMAELRYAQNNPTAAASLFIDCFNRSQQDPTRDDILYNAFLMFLKSGGKDKAIQAAELYQKQFPQGPRTFDVLISWAGLYTQDQKYNEAAALLKPLMDKKGDPLWPQAVFQMGYNLQLLGQNAQALAAYEQLGSQNIDLELKYLVFKNSAILYLKNNEDDKAAQALGWIVDNFPPGNLPIKDYLWLAAHWESNNDPQKMLDVLDKAKKLQGQVAETEGVNFFTAEANRLQHNSLAAKLLYDQIIADTKNKAYEGRAYLGRGYCYVLDGDKVNARKEFEEAVSLNAEDNYVTLRARFELARLFESDQDFTSAAKLYMMVGILYHDTEYGPQALLKAGDLLQKLNDKEEAKSAYQQILQDYPQSQEALKAKAFL